MDPEALAITGFSREHTLAFDDPADHHGRSSARWVKADRAKGRPFFISDNNGFDLPFVSWYLWRFTGGNPFGHSSANLGSLYKGLVQDTFQNFKHLRQTPHTHHPVDDAKGNAEAMLEMKQMGLKIALSSSQPPLLAAVAAGRPALASPPLRTKLRPRPAWYRPRQ